jgi:hypothetical protein
MVIFGLVVFLAGIVLLYSAVTDTGLGDFKTNFLANAS